MENDLISRQAAIDAIHTFQTSNDLYYRESHELMTVGYVEEKLLALPSAQTEQTKMIEEIRKWINSGNR